MQEPVTDMVLEAPGGLVAVRAECRDGKANADLRAQPAVLCRPSGVPLEVPGLGTLTVDTAYGGDSFVIVDAAALGLQLVADEAHRIATLGVQITTAADAQLGFHHPENPDWRHFSFCLFAGPLTRPPMAGKPGMPCRSAPARWTARPPAPPFRRGWR